MFYDRYNLICIFPQRLQSHLRTNFSEVVALETDDSVFFKNLMFYCNEQVLLPYK